MKTNLFLMLILALCFQSCKTDIDINADAKETMVIYGLIDPYNKIHFVKINKTFLGDQDNGATDLAGKPSSYNYLPSEIEAKVERYFEGNLKETYLLKDTILPKNSGIFSTDENIVYYFKPATLLYRTKELRNSSYKIVVKNIKSGITAFAETILLHNNSAYDFDTSLIQFYSPQTPINSAVAYISFYKSNGPTKINIQTSQAVGGRLYQPVIRFYYTEYNTATDSVQKYEDWLFPQQTVDGDVLNLNANSKITYNDIKGGDFYQFVSIKIKPNTALLKRKQNYIEIRMSCAEDVFATYLQVAKPSSGLVVDKPIYTNIKIQRGDKQEEGIGVFSSRTSVKIIRYLDALSVDSLISGYRTKKLGFKYN